MRNEILYYCEVCAKDVYYNLVAVEKCIAKFGTILCNVCRRRTKHGNRIENKAR